MDLYNSLDLREKNPRSFQCRLIIFRIPLATAMRPTELSMLETTQFQMRCVDGENAWIITGMIGCTDGTCKNARGGVIKFNETPKEIIIRIRDQFDGSINVFTDIDKYIQVRQNIKMKPCNNTRFFAIINGNTSRVEEFFKAMVIGPKKLWKIIQDAAEANGIIGLGLNDHIVTLSIRGSVTSIFIEAGVPDSAISKQTEYRCLEYICSY